MDLSVESAQSAVKNIRKNPFFSPQISQIGADFPQKIGIHAQKSRNLFLPPQLYNRFVFNR